MATLEDERSSATSIEEIVRYDPSLTAKILAVANSAYYGFRHEISTVARAVVALGVDELRSLCLGTGLVSFLHPNGFADTQRAELLWLHSLATAEGARLAAEKSGLADPNQAFTAGILHDLGKVVLAAHFPELAQDLVDFVEKQGVDYRAAEKALGLDHCRIGELLAQHWELPPLLCEAILKHHDPAPSQAYFQITTCVHVADSLARKLAMGFSGDPGPPILRPDVWASLQGAQNLGEEMSSRREAIEALWRTMIAS